MDDRAIRQSRLSAARHQFSDALKQLFGGVANVLRIIGGAINNVTLKLFEAIADPVQIPGLRAIDPGSPLIAMLNRPDVLLDGDLSIVSGTFRADS